MTMKITKRELRQLVQEQLDLVNESYKGSTEAFIPMMKKLLFDGSKEDYKMPVRQTLYPSDDKDRQNWIELFNYINADEKIMTNYTYEPYVYTDKSKRGGPKDTTFYQLKSKTAGNDDAYSFAIDDESSQVQMSVELMDQVLQTLGTSIEELKTGQSEKEDEYFSNRLAKLDAADVVNEIDPDDSPQEVKKEIADAPDVVWSKTGQIAKRVEDLARARAIKLIDGEAKKNPELITPEVKTEWIKQIDETLKSAKAQRVLNRFSSFAIIDLITPSPLSKVFNSNVDAIVDRYESCDSGSCIIGNSDGYIPLGRWDKDYGYYANWPMLAIVTSTSPEIKNTFELMKYLQG